MVNPKGVDFDDVQSGNWNVARPYTTELILKWLVKIDEYRTLSIFGYSDIYSDVFVKDPNLKNTARVYSFNRLINALISLIRVTKFAVKPNYKKDFPTYRERLFKILKFVNLLKVVKKRGNRVTQIDVHEALFEKMLSEVDELSDKINFALNDSDLIFTSVQDYDHNKVKESLKNKFIQGS